MKTKNILLPAIALLAGTLLIAPAFAQTLDYHDLEADSIARETRTSISNDVKELASKQEYLNISLLIAQINEGLPIDFEHLKTITQNSLDNNNNKITAWEQYTLMKFCIENGTDTANDVLRTLIEAGFNPKADILDLPPLPALAVEHNNIDAFAYTFVYHDTELTAKVMAALEKKDPSLVNRFFEFANKCMPAEKLKPLPKLENELPKYSENMQNSEKTRFGQNGVVANPNKNAVVAKPKHGSKVNKNAVENEKNQDGITGAYYYNENGTMVIKKFNKLLSKQEYQKWLQENESAKVYNNNAAMLIENRKNNAKIDLETKIALAITDAIISGNYPARTKNTELEGLRNKFQNGELTREQLYAVVLQAVRLNSLVTQ